MQWPMTVFAVALVAVGPACAGDDSPSGGPGSFDDVVHELELGPGEHRTATISTHCGYETLLVDINGMTWSTSELRGSPAQEPTWPNGYEWATFEFSLVDDQTLSVRAEGSEVSLTYRPDLDPPGCA